MEGDRGWRGPGSMGVGHFANEERFEPLLMLPLPLTLNDNNVSLRADPLDFWRLLQFIAVRVVGCPALVCARVVEGEASEVNGASGVCYICGVNMNPVVPRSIKELSVGLIVLLAFNKPPLHLWNGVPYHLAMQLNIPVS